VIPVQSPERHDRLVGQTRPADRAPEAGLPPEAE
jgi:hypothetical protein